MSDEFYKYLVTEQLAELNLPLIERMGTENTRRLNTRLPQFSRVCMQNTN